MITKSLLRKIIVLDSPGDSISRSKIKPLFDSKPSIKIGLLNFVLKMYFGKISVFLKYTFEALILG